MENTSLLAGHVASPSHPGSSLRARSAVDCHEANRDTTDSQMDSAGLSHTAPQTPENYDGATRLARADGASETPLIPASSCPEMNSLDTLPHDPASPQPGKMAIVSVAPHVRADRTFWTPIWLYRRTLFGFAALFICMAASLVVLLVVNNASRGFPPLSPTYHYAWTYSPTAVLVCVLSLWRQVDYHCKLMQPWQEMSKGQVDAERSVLLDYLSPMLLVSLVQAVRNHHAPVAASVAGFITLKAIILLSTGLLILTPVQSIRPQPVVIDTVFDSESFWNTVSDDAYILFNESPDTGVNISSLPVHDYLRSLEEHDAGPDLYQAWWTTWFTSHSPHYSDPNYLTCLWRSMSSDLTSVARMQM
jgi:hypothetical protein